MLYLSIYVSCEKNMKYTALTIQHSFGMANARMANNSSIWLSKNWNRSHIKYFRLRSKAFAMQLLKCTIFILLWVIFKCRKAGENAGKKILPDIRFRIFGRKSLIPMLFWTQDDSFNAVLGRMKRGKLDSEIRIFMLLMN